MEFKICWFYFLQDHFFVKSKFLMTLSMVIYFAIVQRILWCCGALIMVFFDLDSWPQTFGLERLKLSISKILLIESWLGTFLITIFWFKLLSLKICDQCMLRSVMLLVSFVTCKHRWRFSISSIHKWLKNFPWIKMRAF